MKIKAITFDYWDTLVPINREKIETMREKRALRVSEFLKEKGFNFSFEEIKKISGEVWELYRDNPSLTREVTLYVMVEEILDSLGIEKRRDIMEGIVEIYEEYLYKAGLSVDKEVVKVIKDLKREGFRLGVISNTPGGNVERRILEDAGIIGFFEILLFSSFEGVRKPHPEIFMKAVKFFKIEPYELLHIGDTPELDVEGPLKIGAKAILWDPEGNKGEIKGVLKIRKWGELRKILNLKLS